MIYLLWFIFGTLLGSFCLLVIERFPKNGFKTSLQGRSKCDNCKKILAWTELIPVISFLIQKGKCVKCHNKLSIRYPISELLFGLLTALIAFYSPSFSQTLLNVAITLILIIIAGIDFLEKAVVEQLVIIAGVLALISSITTNNFNSGIQGLLIGGGLFAILVVISREKWMGYGDIEVGAVLGLWLGYPRIILALILAFVVGALYGIILIKSNKAGLKSQVPFVPFLVLGGLISLFWGQKIINFYLGT